MDYISTKEASKKQGISEQRQKLCEERRIDKAVRLLHHRNKSTDRICAILLDL